MSTTTNAVNPFAAIAAQVNGSSKPTTATSDSASSDRFLKLLVTQMQNQDPLNPMDNAQVTSQMAQISTVNGISQLNATMNGLNSQFTALQAVQGAGLVGHDVTLQGNKLYVDPTSGQGIGGFELTSPADAVQVEIRNGAGSVMSTQNLGAQPTGMSGFTWAGGAAGTDYTFRVTATASGNKLSTTSLMRDHVNAVSNVGNVLTLQTTKSGPVAYSDVKAVS